MCKRSFSAGNGYNLCNVPYKAKAATTYSMSTSAITLLKGKKHKLKIVNAPKMQRLNGKLLTSLQLPYQKRVN